MGVTHMNGRFMSADPFIQSSDNLQSYNSYLYVMGNPLAFHKTLDE